jgi:transposase InsO family protein
MEELEKHGLVFKNPDARWGSAPRVVPKKDGSLRMTVDLRAVNEVTEPKTWPMPHQEAEMADLEGATCFFGLDGFKQYWQEGLASESRELLSIVTPVGIYTPTRVLMGATDAVAHTQEAMERVMAPVLNRGVKVWLDDVLGHARNEGELLDCLEVVFERCERYGLKLHPGKCDFYKATVKWCGKVISANGVSHCPIRIQGLCDMPVPQTAADLQQFLCACNWMRASIPRYNEVVNELLTLMETCMSKCGSRKKIKLAKLLLKDCGWEDIHDRAYYRLKDALSLIVPLAHPKEDADVCVFTDASQDHWGAVITQVRPGELSKPREEQDHQPLAFLSGSFKGASSRWPIVEKEAYAIVETCKRMEYLLLRERGFHLFTDHRNLQYIFDPKSVNGNIARYQADKLQRWSMVLQMFRYQIEYIKGEENVWGDLLSRWGSKTMDQQQVAVSRKVMRLVSTAPLKEEDFEWPSLEEIAQVQGKDKEPTEELVRDSVSKCLVTKSGKIWIPNEAVELKQRLCVIAHAGLAGHRGINTTVKVLQSVFAWKGMQGEVSAFINSCLHCLVVDGKRVPRPLGETLTATKPNESIHFDFMQLPKSVDGYEYVLVIKDAMSGFVELTACPSCTAEECVEALCEWFKRYGPVFQWVSDQGSHFKNQVVDAMAKLFGANHHFVTAYCPWANGTVEVVNRMLLRVLKTMLSEEKLPMGEWTKILFQVQMALNFNPSSRLDGVAPVTGFLALPACTPLKTFYLSKYDGTLPKITEAMWSAEVQQHIKELQATIDQMHKKLSTAAAKKLLTKRDRQRVSARPPNFEVGDFVLVGRTLARGNKLALEWKGPCRVVNVKSHWLYEVQTLFEPVVTMTHHVSRLKFYVDKERGNIGDFKSYAVAHQDKFLVDKLIECRCVQGSWEIKVKWQGFDELECSWEPLDVLQADVPVYVQTALRELPHASFKALKDYLAAPN